jgi:hypothetical protein
LKLQSGPVKRACNALEASFVQFPMEKFAMIDKKKHNFEAVPSIVTVIKAYMKRNGLNIIPKLILNNSIPLLYAFKKKFQHKKLPSM